jgi:hypothetical protein
MFTRIALPVVATTLLTGLALQADATPGVTYNDAINDIAPGLATANGTLDLVKMEVSNTATDVVFQLTVNGNIGSTDWGKFMIGISSSGTKTATGNGWGRPINMSSNGGMTHWIGSWVDGSSVQAPTGGAEFYTYNNGSSTWTRNAATWDAGTYPYPYTVTAGAQSTVQWSFPLALMNLVPGNVIYFDAYSSGGGGGDTAIDSLANPNVSVTSWGETYTSYATGAGGPGLNAYTVSAVPEPSSMAAVGLAGAAIAGHLMRRRRSA